MTFGAVFSVDEAADDAQSREIGALVPFADGAGLTVSSPFHLDGATKVAPVRAPAVGQHSETVLRDAGYAADEIARLKALGVLQHVGADTSPIFAGRLCRRLDFRYTPRRWLMERSKSMTAQTKGRIRHVALSVKDPWETAEFYKQAVGLQEVMELDGPLAEGVFLTDGVVNLAILHFKSDEASQGTGMDYVGIHHIGFWVDDVVEQGKIARNVGATWIMGDPEQPARL